MDVILLIVCRAEEESEEGHVCYEADSEEKLRKRDTERVTSRALEGTGLGDNCKSSEATTNT